MVGVLEVKSTTITLEHFKDWWNRRVQKPIPISDKKLQEAIDTGNRIMQLHRQRHTKEK